LVDVLKVSSDLDIGQTEYSFECKMTSVTRLSQRLLPNVVLKFYQIGFFFTKHVQIPRFEISGCVQAL
jgi:hypothetical protein